MNAALALRHGLEIALLLPAAVYTLIPLWRWLRKPWRAMALATGVCLLLAFCGGICCARFHLASDQVRLAAALLGVPALLLRVKLPWPKCAFCCANSAMLCALCTLYNSFVTAPLETGNPEGVLTAASGAVCLGLSAVTGLAFGRTLRRKLPELLSEKRIDRIWPVMAALALAMALFFRWITPISNEVIMTGRVRPISLVLFLFFPAIVLVLYHLLWWTARRLAESARMEQQMQVLRTESQRYRDFRENMGRTRMLRHDFRQHLRVISTLAQEGQYEQLKEYLTRFESTAGDRQTIYCANPAIDAILAWYAGQAEQAGIGMELSVDLPRELPMDETDYCVLVGNLLENALRAARAVPDGSRSIRVISSMLSEAMLGLSVENPYRGSVRLDDQGLPVTSDPAHGMGLLSASAVVQRYQGTMEIKTENQRFAVSVLLCL